MAKEAESFARGRVQSLPRRRQRLTTQRAPGHQCKGAGGRGGGSAEGADGDCTADDCAPGDAGACGGGLCRGAGRGRDAIFCLSSCSAACNVAMLCAMSSCRAASCSMLCRTPVKSRAIVSISRADLQASQQPPASERRAFGQQTSGRQAPIAEVPSPASPPPERPAADWSTKPMRPRPAMEPEPMAANPGSRPAPMWRPRSSPARRSGHPRTATSAWRRHRSKTRCKSGRRRATYAGQTRADLARSVDPGSRQRRERRAATVPPPPTPETTLILRARFRQTEPARMPATVLAPGWRNRVRAALLSEGSCAECLGTLLSSNRDEQPGFPARPDDPGRTRPSPNDQIKAREP